MGAVYRGLDTQTGQIVAIKQLKPEVIKEDSSLIKRFTRESAALRRLDHPNIVKCLAAVEESGQHYLVMEYVSGGTLADLVQKQSMPIPQIVAIALELSDALTRAHHLKIIHRDIKPANVLLAEDGTPRLTDFGVAHTGDSNLTNSGVLVGTYAYLSPEALNGESLDARADLWAFGVMLYEMLTGSRPFAGEHPAAVMSAILTQTVPDLELLRRDAPIALVDLVYRMLEKDRNHRIASARQVGAELEAILRNDPERARRIAPAETVVDALPEVVGVSPAAAITPSQPQRHNLPVQTSPFVGRENELAELTRLLSDPAVRLITILGSGGMGKTRLALETAATQFAAFADGVYFVPLAPLSSADLVVSTLADSVNYTFSGSLEPRQQMLSFLRIKTMLLIFDNYEHVMAEAGLVANILQAAPNVKIIVTSRERLNIQDETLFRIEGLDLPGTESLETAVQHSALTLFVQSARRVQPGFKLNSDNLPAVVQICQLVRGVPLGILLAAAWVEMLTPAEIADEITKSLDFLETETRDVPSRQRSLRAVFDYSWALLSDTERHVFSALSIFRGGFTREAAQAVTGASLRDLAGLVNKSLLRRNPTGRYEVHELLRQYAEQKLRESSDADAVRDAHGAYFAAYIDQQNELMLKSQRTDIDIYTEFDVEIENIRATWNWAIAGKQFDAVERLTQSFFLYCETRGETREMIDLFRRAAKVLESVANSDAEWNVIAGLRGRAAFFLAVTGQFQEAVSFGDGSVAIARRTGNQRVLGYSLNGATMAHLFTGQAEFALSMAYESLIIAREIDDIPMLIFILNTLGSVFSQMKQFDQARRYLDESLVAARRYNSLTPLARGLMLIGQVQHEAGEYEDARRTLQETVALSRRLNDTTVICVSLTFLGASNFQLGDSVAAKPILREAIAVSYDRQVLLFTLLSLSWYALLVAEDGQPERAVEWLAMVSHHPQFAVLYQEMIDAFNARLSSQLSPEAMQAAQQRGQQLNLDAVVKQFLAETQPT